MRHSPRRAQHCMSRDVCARAQQSPGRLQLSAARTAPRCAGTGSAAKGHARAASFVCTGSRADAACGPHHAVYEQAAAQLPLAAGRRARAVAAASAAAAAPAARPRGTAGRPRPAARPWAGRGCARRRRALRARLARRARGRRGGAWGSVHVRLARGPSVGVVARGAARGERAAGVSDRERRLRPGRQPAARHSVSAAVRL